MTELKFKKLGAVSNRKVFLLTRSYLWDPMSDYALWLPVRFEHSSATGNVTPEILSIYKH